MFLFVCLLLGICVYTPSNEIGGCTTTTTAGPVIVVYRNIFVEHKFRKSRPCIIILYIRIDGLQNLK